MKRFIACAMALLMFFMLAGCGNMSVGFGNFTFEHIHFYDYTESYCANVDRWYDNSSGIEVKTDEYGSMYLTEGSYILIGDEADCPFCGE